MLVAALGTAQWEAPSTVPCTCSIHCRASTMRWLIVEGCRSDNISRPGYIYWSYIGTVQRVPRITK